MTIRDDVKKARRTLRAFQQSERIAPAAPTPERLNKAGRDYAIEDAITVAAIIGEDGRPKVAEIRAKRIRMKDAPLARLAARGQLAPGDRFLNMALEAAGERYAEHWHNGTPAFSALDPAKPVVSSSRLPAFFASEWQLSQWQEWLAASLKLYPEHRAVVECVVLHDRDPATIARELTGRADKQTGVAVVLDRLVCGLRDLARHYGMVEKGGGGGGRSHRPGGAT
jgi:hypothetical protein